MLAGAFVTDPAPGGYSAGVPLEQTWHGVAHDFVALFAFLALPGAMFVMARRFRDDGSRWALYSVLSGVGMLTAFVGIFVANAVLPDWVGLVQRVSIIIGFGWVAQVCWRFRQEVSATGA